MQLITEQKLFNSQLFPQVNSKFSAIEAIANEYCKYLAGEGIHAVAIHEDERDRLEAKFNALSEEQQNSKLQSFLKRYQESRTFYMKGGSARDKKLAFEMFMDFHSIKISSGSDSVLDLIDNDTVVEVYNLDFVQVFRTPNMLEKTNHSILAMEVSEWWDLFSRSEHITKDIFNTIDSMHKGIIKEPIFNPVEEHTVKEIGTKSMISSQAKSIVLAPVELDTGELEGIVHMFKVVNNRSLNFHILQ